MNPQLLQRYKRQIAVYRDRTAAQMVAAWGRLHGIDEQDVVEFERATAVSLSGGETAAVALSAAFFSLALGIRPVGVSTKDLDLEADIRGPFRAAWHALNMGRPYEEALAVGRSTAQAVGFDFVQSAARRTGDVVAKKSGERVRWVRVPGGNACEWCQLVAGQSYHSAESADFGHERDSCDVIPEV